MNSLKYAFDTQHNFFSSFVFKLDLKLFSVEGSIYQLKKEQSRKTSDRKNFCSTIKVIEF